MSNLKDKLEDVFWNNWLGRCALLAAVAGFGPFMLLSKALETLTAK